MSILGLSSTHRIDFQAEADFINDAVEAALVALISTEGVSSGIELDGSVTRSVFTVVAEFLGLPSVARYVEDNDIDPEYLGVGLVRSANGHVSEFTGELRESAKQFAIEIYVIEGVAYAVI